MHPLHNWTLATYNLDVSPLKWVIHKTHIRVRTRTPLGTTAWLTLAMRMYIPSPQHLFSRKALRALLVIPEAYPCTLVLAGLLHLHKASFLCLPTSRSACLYPMKQVTDTRLAGNNTNETAEQKHTCFLHLSFAFNWWKQTSKAGFYRKTQEATQSYSCDLQVKFGSCTAFVLVSYTSINIAK